MRYIYIIMIIINLCILSSCYKTNKNNTNRYYVNNSNKERIYDNNNRYIGYKKKVGNKTYYYNFNNGSHVYKGYSK